jgi:uncharacterized integral membrane protein
VLKLLFVVLSAVVVTVFAMDNMRRVELGLIVGKPVHVRLFFLLLTSYLIGCFSTMLANLYLSAKSKKQEKATQDTEGDEYFPE